MQVSLADAAKYLNVDWPADDRRFFNGVAVDSREIKGGNLFVCIKGEKVDGHDFVKMAQQNGASAILAEKEFPELDIPVLVVPDTIKALGGLACACRDKTDARVICLTGTAGKTTLKDTLSAIMSEAGKTLATKGNHNNQIGLPLTILNAAGDEKFWIIEAGISHAGDMDELGAIVKPDLAIILNVGPGHTGGLGSRGVAWNKTRLFKYISSGGKAVISADYPDLVAETETLGIKPTRFSIKNNEADFAAIGGNPERGIYTLRLGKKCCDFETPFFGEYGAETAVAAAAIAWMCGVDEEKIAKGFSHISLPPQRFRLLHEGKWHIFDDTYNANPLSMRRMLLAAKEYANLHSLPLVVILGEMGELGEQAEKCHEAIGEVLGDIKPVKVFWKGAYLENIQKGLDKKGFSSAIVPFGDDFAQKWEMNRASLPEAGIIIFKGSRANHLEKTLEVFKGIISGESHVL